MKDQEDKEKTDNKLQTELLVEIEKHERRVLDVLDRLSKKSDADMIGGVKDATTVLDTATKELNELMGEHEKNKEVYVNLVNRISERISTIPEDFVRKYLEDFPNKFELNKPDWWEKYPEPKEFPSEIKISNLPKSQDNKDLKGHLTKLFTELWNATKEHTARIFITNKTPKEAIPVVLVDAEGKNKYTAIFSGGGSGAAAGGVSVTQYKEDAVHTSGDTGTMSLGVRSDKLANLTSDSGDYTPFQFDFDGALYTNAKIFDPGTVDTFGHVITGEISNQIERQFFRDTPANLLTITSSNGGTTSQVGGSGKFESSTNVNGAVKGVTVLKTSYRSGSEIFTVFTASFTTPTDAGSYQRIGLYDTNDGMFFGFEGTSFGITVRNGTSDITVAKGSFSEDKLTGAIGSRFRRNGVPEAIDLTKLNVYRIRYGWLGSAPINFEVLSPDDEWVAMHIIRQPNNATTPSVENPDLPMTIDINKTTSDATNLIMLTNCWGAGTTTSSIPLDETLTDSTLSKSVRAILAAKKPNGTYQNIDSTAGGNLKMSVQEISDGLDIGAGNADTETQRVSISTDDVNLSSIKKSISGASAPTIDSYTQVAINLDAGANQVLVSSSPNKQIWVYGVVYTCSVAGTVSFQDEDDTAVTGIMDHAEKSGLSHPTSGNFAMPIWKLATNKDLEVDVVTAAIDGFLDYAIVSV